MGEVGDGEDIGWGYGQVSIEGKKDILSMSSKNSNILSWYIAITRDPSISKYTSRTRRESTVCWGEGERLVDIRQRWEFLR